MPPSQHGSAVADLLASRGKQSDAEWAAVVAESAVVEASHEVCGFVGILGSSAGATFDAIRPAVNYPYRGQRGFIRAG